MADGDLNPTEVSHLIADRLALAFEDAGFNVGTAFPELRQGWDVSGAPGVRIGSVTSEVAADLAALLFRATNAGVTLPLA
jgi:hypothetical protein